MFKVMPATFLKKHKDVLHPSTPWGTDRHKSQRRKRSSETLAAVTAGMMAGGGNSQTGAWELQFKLTGHMRSTDFQLGSPDVKFTTLLPAALTIASVSKSLLK